MKHQTHGYFCLIAFLILVAAGCSTSGKVSKDPDPVASIPGSVLGPAPESATERKTVTFSVIGKGLEPERATTKGEARLMAERAAMADGYRQLVEKLSGVYVDAYMKAGYGSVSQDVVTTKAQSWLRGVELVEIRDAKHGITEAHMQLSIHFTKRNMIWWPSGLGGGAKYDESAVVTGANGQTYRLNGSAYGNAP